MSTMKVNRLENTSTASGGLDIDTSGNVRVTTLVDSAGNNDSTPAEIASGRAKAWVNFDGTGTVSIRTSYNVASITDNGIGEFDINFTNAMANAQYIYAGFANNEGSRLATLGSDDFVDGNTTTQAKIRTTFVAGTNGQSNRLDCSLTYIAFFGD